MTTLAPELKAEPPEPTSSCLGDYSSLAMHLKLTEVDDVENSVNRIEADIDRSRRPFQYYLIQIPTIWIDPYQRAPDGWSSGGRHWRLVTEERDEDLSYPLMGSRRCHVEFRGCRMGREAGQRSTRVRQFVVVGEHERRRWSPLRAVLRGSNGFIADEVGPSIPGAFPDLEEHVGRIAHGAASPIVRPLIDGEQPPVWQETKPVGVSQPSGDQLEPSPVRVAPHDRRARQLRRHSLTRLALCGEWGESSRSCDRFAVQGILRLEVDTPKGDVVAG